MRRIAMVLKSSEAASVRKAATAAGANLVIVTPISKRNGAVNLGRWYCDDVGADQAVRLEVIAEDESSNAIVSAILAHARAGGIENIIPFPSGKQSQTVLPETVRQVVNG